MLCIFIFTVSTASCSPRPASQRLVVATTHTLEDSGILDSIRAGFKIAHPEEHLNIVVAGSGEVLTIGKRGDADVLLTHAPDDEKAFVASGYGVARRPVAHNEFLIVGPPSDAAEIGQAASAADAFVRIKSSGQMFVSRADQSGTHKKELAIWKAAGIEPDSAHYIRTGTSMADALRIADEKHAYALTDIATFLALRNTLAVQQLYAGDPMLRNDYSVIVVKNARNTTGANAFADWITGAAAQKMIGDFGRAKYGRPVFTADGLPTSKPPRL